MQHYLIKYVKEILEDYNGKQPLIKYLKGFYKKEKQLGKRDRNAITSALFEIYRYTAVNATKSIYPLQIIENSKNKNGFSYWKFLLENRIEAAFINDLKIDLNYGFLLEEDNLKFSKGFTIQDFKELINNQSKVFFRIKNSDKEVSNFEKINLDGIPVFYTEKDTKLDQFFSEENYIIQDLSSQKSLIKAWQLLEIKEKEEIHVWDVCAGAGGKSLLLQDLHDNISITATDVRKSILIELQRRQNLYFKNRNKIYSFNWDVAKSCPNNVPKQDVVLIDAPCSGSGTWGRSPERKVFFEKNEWKTLQNLQKNIIKNAAEKVKEDAWLIYITCSVFYEENEAVVQDFLNNNLNFTSVYQELIIGNEHKADSLFYAVLKRK